MLRCNLLRKKASHSMKGKSHIQLSVNRGKEGTHAMFNEHISTSWTEVVTALAVMGIITFLLWL